MKDFSQKVDSVPYPTELFTETQWVCFGLWYQPQILGKRTGHFEANVHPKTMASIMFVGHRTAPSRLWTGDVLFLNNFFKMYIFIFGCAGSLWLYRFSLTVGSRDYSLVVAWASHCSGFSCCQAWALGMWASVLVAHGLSSCGSRAPKHRLSSCGSRA